MSRWSLRDHECLDGCGNRRVHVSRVREGDKAAGTPLQDISSSMVLSHEVISK